jgi:hypothetical protein
MKTCGGGGGGGALERLDVLKSSKQPHLALELLKYCSFEHYHGGLFVDSQSPLTCTLDRILMTANGASLAVLNDPKISPKSIHSSIMYVSSSDDSTKNSVVEGMIQVLMTTKLEILESSPLLLPKSLYDYVATDAKMAPLAPGNNNNKWYLLQHTCHLSASIGQRQVTAPISNYALTSHRYVLQCHQYSCPW